MVMICAEAAAAVLAASSPAAAAPPAQEQPVSIVLVHGAFVDGSGWEQVYHQLTDDGYQVIVVQNSTATLTGDVETTDRAIATARHPVVLVGHSYGGAVITQAGNNPKVKSLAYVAAYAPDTGESVWTLIAKPIPGAWPVPILPAQGGYLLMDEAKFPRSFASDVPIATTSFMAASQVPWGMPAIHTAITHAAWHDKPTYFLITTEDHMIPTPQQRDLAKRAHANVSEIGSSHAVMLAHPEDVTKYIEHVAEETH